MELGEVEAKNVASILLLVPKESKTRKAQRAFFLLFIRIRNKVSCFTGSVGTIVFPETTAIAQCPPRFWQI